MNNIRAALTAEKELQRFKADTSEEKTAAYMLFMKHICGFELFPTQLLQAEQYFRYPYVIEVKPPRSGKSKGKSGINLYECALNADEDLRIYTPKFDIGRDSLSYQYDWIEKSPLLRSYIRVKNGKRQISSVNYEFRNHSNARIITVAGKIEGHNVTIADIMEFDLWDWKTYQDDVMRRFGAQNENGLPTRVRIDGTILGQENIYKIITNEKYKNLYHNLMYTDANNILGLPVDLKMDVDFMLAMGVLDPVMTEFQKSQMSPDEVQRSFYLNFTESTNFIWSAYVAAVMRKSAKWGLEGVPFEKGGRYESEGVVGCGFDCGHAGQSDESSQYSLQIYEQIGRYRRWLNGFEWAADYDTSQLEIEVLEILAFYQPEGGYADALKHNFIASINDKAWRDGLTDKCRDDFPENTPGNWEQWWLSPLWNSDKNKHFYYDSLQMGIHKLTCFYPFYTADDDRHEAKMMRTLLRTMYNVRKEKTRGAYPRYTAADPKIGDDHTDAGGMANLWLDLHADPSINMNLVSTGKSIRMSEINADSISLSEIERDNFGSF